MGTDATVKQWWCAGQPKRPARSITFAKLQPIVRACEAKAVSGPRQKAKFAERALQVGRPVPPHNPLGLCPSPVSLTVRRLPSIPVIDDLNMTVTLEIPHMRRQATDATLVGADETTALLGKPACQDDDIDAYKRATLAASRSTPVPWGQLLALCATRLSDPISFTHIFVSIFSTSA
jgi:hypothetical protein